MKKIICIILVFVAMVSLSMSASAANSEQMVLSELTEDECIAFIKEKGVEIPDGFGDESVWGVFIKEVISQVEEKPNTGFLYENSILLDFAEEIQRVVNEFLVMME